MMLACMKHQAVEAGGLSSDCESVLFLRIDVQRGKPAMLILIILHSV